MEPVRRSHEPQRTWPKLHLSPFPNANVIRSGRIPIVWGSAWRDTSSGNLLWSPGRMLDVLACESSQANATGLL